MVLLTVEEVAFLLKRSKSTIYKWVSSGDHMGKYFKRIGGKPMITEEDFDKYCKECR